MVPNLSSAKSPQQMFGAVTKTYFAEKKGIDPKKIFCVSVMPCTAKKYESAVPEVNSADAGLDVDVVLTTREIDRMLKANHINVAALEEQDFDSPLGSGTGAAVIFGATGGVMEAALRSAYFLITGNNPDADAFTFIRGVDGVRCGTLNINGIEVSVAATSGLANTRKLIEDIRAGKAHYDFIEIMACPGGCAGGGGQPINDGWELAGERGNRLYTLDKNANIRFSHENADVLELYKDFLHKPLSHKSHELLHTDQVDWTIKACDMKKKK
jgi:NADH-quinone oxidoreductase subunit G